MTKPRTQNDGGFPLPEIVDPPRIEFCISVPDDPTHLKAFWGAMWELTRWYNWQKKDEQQAKPVADVWLQVWLENQERYEERLCMPPEACCDDTNDLLRQILAVMQGGFKIVPFTSDLPSDFTVDCTPDDFDGNEGDDVPTQIKRYNAMCLALNRWMVSILGNSADKMNQTGKLPDIWALAGFVSAPKMFGQIQYVENDMSVAHLNEVLASDTAFNLMICRAMLELQQEGNSFVIFKKQFEEIYNDVSTGENAAFTILAMIARDYSTSRVNYTLFSRELERAFEDIEGGDPFDCGCQLGVCDVDDFVIVSDNGAICTKIDEDTWHIEQSAFEITETDHQRFMVQIRDANWRCFNHLSTSVGQSGYKIYNCSGVEFVGSGGGGGELVWHELRIDFPDGSHITPPLAFNIGIACPS